ncbi:MAG: efflux transporter outer membrane subunit, partial [Synergistaceae bacterium]|nr:efflux transporter outer membrane subunit [Synergistaceae bacterium]
LRGGGMMKKINIAIITIFILLTAGAVFAENIQQSADIELTEGKWVEMSQRFPIPSMSIEAVSEPDPEMLAKWWESLNDEILTQLVEWSLESNRDLASARSKVTEARAALGINKAALLPWLDNTDYWYNSRTPVQTGGKGKGIDIYRLGIDASWEIDIFGGRRETVKAGAASLEAQYASLQAAWVSLSAEVALNYLTLRTLQERLFIAEKNLLLQEETLEMLQSRVDAGLSDHLALSQSKYTLEQTKAEIPPIQKSIEEVKNSLAILTGRVPGSLDQMLSERKPLPKLDQEMMTGIPANSIRQRPDIFAAERQLAAQIARKKSARADLWPKFYLLGSIGTEGLDTGSLFEGPNKAYSFGPKIVWPIFHAGAIRNNIKVHTARQEQYLAAYEQTVLKAVAEVRTALTAGIEERKRNEALRRGTEAAQTALDVANDKYRNGLTDFNNVINAQRALLSLSEATVISDGQITSDTVMLFKALGGGWAPISEEYETSAAKK